VVAHVTRDLDHFQGQKVKGQGHRGHIVAAARLQLVTTTLTRALNVHRHERNTIHSTLMNASSLLNTQLLEINFIYTDQHGSKNLYIFSVTHLIVLPAASSSHTKILHLQ